MNESFPRNYILKLDSLCQYIYQRNFHHMEKALIELLNIVFIHAQYIPETKDQDIAIIDLIYAEFNAYYYTWLEKFHLKITEEFNELRCQDHFNILIAHCSQVEYMDDLLFELSNYFILNEGPHQKNRVEILLKKYRKIARKNNNQTTCIIKE
jgi:hypothetical protein